jgi:hypothetical protein
LDISPAVLPTWCAVGFPFGGFVICSYSLTGARLVVRYIQLSKKKNPARKQWKQRQHANKTKTTKNEKKNNN